MIVKKNQNKKELKTLCVIPARGGSKSLKEKNIQLLFGKPLIHWPIKAALQSNQIDEIFVYTDNKKIANEALKAGASVPFMRADEISQDLTTTEETLKSAIVSYEQYVGYEFDIAVFLTCTDIFRKTEWIDEAINILKENPKIESAFSVSETHKNFWEVDDNGNPKRISSWMREYSNRQVRKKIYREDTGLACASIAKLWREGRRIGDKVHLVSNSNGLLTSIDIHNEFDLYMAEKAISYLKENRPSLVSLFLG
jgi:CMP-N,N'-diacetyllegionaminic acid synthase